MEHVQEVAIVQLTKGMENFAVIVVITFLDIGKIL